MQWLTFTTNDHSFFSIHSCRFWDWIFLCKFFFFFLNKKQFYGGNWCIYNVIYTHCSASIVLTGRSKEVQTTCLFRCYSYSPENSAPRMLFYTVKHSAGAVSPSWHVARFFVMADTCIVIHSGLLFWLQWQKKTEIVRTCVSFHNPEASYLLTERTFSDGGFQVGVRRVVE